MPNNTRPDSNLLKFFGEDKLFPDPISSDFGDFVRKAVEFFHRHPEIETLILADQRAAALADKHESARADNDEAIRTEPLFAEFDADLVACSLELGVGRPRMHPLVVFVFLQLRGRLGGPCRASFRDMVLESRSLEEVLRAYVDTLPAAATILENLNILSDDTLATIHRLQLAEALEEGIDDFQRIAVDSTA